MRLSTEFSCLGELPEAPLLKFENRYIGTPKWESPPGSGEQWKIVSREEAQTHFDPICRELGKLGRAELTRSPEGATIRLRVSAGP